MFTGLIEEIGKVKDISLNEVSNISIYCPLTTKKASLGDSIAVNGVCLTVSKIFSDYLVFNAVKETVTVTNLSELKAGNTVNLETALTLSKSIGGHFVSGHIDGVGKIIKTETIGTSKEITFEIDKEILKYVVNKGSIAIDGISLTVATVTNSIFKIAIIPHTLKSTILMNKKIGDKVNIETDILGKYVEKLLLNNNNSNKGLMTLLGESGYL